MERIGASPEDWHLFSERLGLTEDLLPVVQNTQAHISPASTLKAVGKTPSRYNDRRQVVGIQDWTKLRAEATHVHKWAVEPDYGICIQTRRVRVLDVDVEDPKLAQNLKRVIAAILPDVPFRTRANSARFLVAFRLDGAYQKRILRSEKGIIEFLADGQQFVAAGTHPSGARYLWSPEVPRFPEVSADTLARLMDVLSQTVNGTWSDQKRQVNGHDAMPLPDDPVVGALEAADAVLGVARDGAVYIKCPWLHLHTGDSGPSETVYFPAGTGGYELGHFKCQHAHCVDRTDAEFLSHFGAGLQFDDVTGAAPPDTRAERFKVVPAGDFINGPTMRWAIKGILPAQDLVMVYGAPGSGKSFVVLDWALTLEKDPVWNGFRVFGKKVIYVAAEGAAGVRCRIAAACQARGVDPASLTLGVIADAPNLLTGPDAKRIETQIEAWGGADVIILDTVAAVTPGGDENSAQDMGVLIARAKRLAQHFGGLVILVHHAGKDATKGARGSSVFLGAVDAEFHVSHTPGQRTVINSKQKDGRLAPDFPFSLPPVTLGVDDDGDAITSCVVDWHPLDQPAGSGVRLGGRVASATDLMALQAARDQRMLHGELVPLKALVEDLAGRMPDTRTRGLGRDRRGEAARRIVDRLLECGALTLRGERVRVPGE